MSISFLPVLKQQDKAILLAIGIGLAIVFPVVGYMGLTSGEPFLPLFGITVMLSLFAAVPFLVLAAKGITAQKAWLVGVALTISVGAYCGYQSWEYRRSGSNTGADFVVAAVFTLAPLYISIICVWIGRWIERRS